MSSNAAVRRSIARMDMPKNHPGNITKSYWYNKHDSIAILPKNGQGTQHALLSAASRWPYSNPIISVPVDTLRHSANAPKLEISTALKLFCQIQNAQAHANSNI